MVSESSDPAASPGVTSESSTAQAPLVAVHGPQSPGWMMTCVRAIGVLIFLYLFLVSIKAMGGGLKIYAQDPVNEAHIHKLFAYAENPFVGLAVGILLTSIVQSSSFTTSFIIALVAAAPALAVAAGSPLLFGKRLWRETRIALFQQSIDTPSARPDMREIKPRVHFDTH